MKKLKYLPLIGVSLLALVSCGNSNNEISESKALSLYDLSVAQQYVLVPEKCSLSNDIDPSVKSIFEFGLFSYIPEFDEGFIATATPENCFFGEVKAENLKTAANYFREYMTYTLEGKTLTAEFTGSNDNEEYGIAMNCSYRFQSAGLIKSAHYTFAYADKDGKSVYHANLELEWGKA